MIAPENTSPESNLKSGSLSSNHEGNTLLMSWIIKTHAHPTRFMDIAMAIFSLFPLIFYIYGVFFHENENSRHSVLNSAIFGEMLILFFWIVIVRQKTCYTYRITEKGGELDYWLHFPKFSGYLFKGIAIFAFICVLSVIAIMPIMIFALVGPAGMLLLNAKALLNWENEKHRDWFAWDEFKHVIIDRKRNVVVFLKHPVVFEAFLAKDQIDKYLAVIRPRMPPDTQYVEERWVD